MSENQERKQRVFFAIAPDESALVQLRELQENLKQKFSSEKIRWTTPDNLHLTLNFLGLIDQQQMSCVVNVAKTLQIPSFQMQFDQLGMFKKAGICWLGCKNDPPVLLALQQELTRKLCECGFEPEQRLYRPHVTLARNFSASLVGIRSEKIDWEVKNVQLMESKPVNKGVYYRTLEIFPSNVVF